jgi:hypothetical protein
MALYAIHDPWFHGRSDGDVDDRAAFCAYDRYLRDHPSDTIRVCVGDRLSNTLEYYGHTRISFTDKIQRQDLLEASRILICAPVLDAADREMLREIMAERGNGYAQGCKIGCMNFPNANYLPLLSAVTHPYSTVDTMITFPVEFLMKLDPYYKDYLCYGCIKLFSPGAILHIPGLLYRLYCPGIGGGPGTNMLSIQRILQTFGILTHIPVDKDHFIEFNQTLCEEKKLVPIPAILRATTIPELIQSLTVMTYFANLVYQVGGPLYHEGSEIYSLQSLPQGVCLVEDPPPLYDLVAAHWTLYGLQRPEEILAFY